MTETTLSVIYSGSAAATVRWHASMLHRITTACYSGRWCTD